MGRSSSEHVRKGVAAGIVLLAHVVLLLLFVLARVPVPVDADPGEYVIATLIDQPRPRNLSFGPVPVQVNTENVLHLQRLAPRIQDIPVESPEDPQTETTEPMAASAPLPEHADAGMNSDPTLSVAESGGGNSLTLLQRFIPKYPAASAMRGEEGLTSVVIHVDPQGQVQDVKVTHSSGSRRLDEAAVAAFRKWKFAPAAGGSAPEGVWLQTEQRFILYRLRYSRLGDKAADNIDVESVQGAKDNPVRGSQQALDRFIHSVKAESITDNSGVVRRALARMKSALNEWGAVKSITFTGSAGPRDWTLYRVRSDVATDFTAPTAVAVKWNLFEVQHEHATTEWLVAVDRNGTLWSARVSAAPWVQTRTARN
jgi:TonB family protein